MADLDSEFAQAEQTVKQGKKAFEENLRRLQADDRSHIAKLIVWAFVILMAVVVLAISIATVAQSDWSKISEPAKFLMSILSSVMLPVVTLVIGHYFGKEK